MKSNYIAAGMLTICMMAQSFPVLAADSQSVSIDSFTDAGIIQGHWALKDINTALEHKGISGYTDGSFKPNGKITTAELLSMILNTSGKGITGEGVWPVNVMNTAYALGIITPEEIPASEADTALVREKMAMILVKSAVVLNGEETENIEQVNRNLIFDIDEADPKYQDFIMDAYSLGLLAVQKTYRAEALSEVKEKLNYLNEDRFLEVAVVRNILFYREDPEYRSYFEDYRMSPRCEELYQGFEKVSALRHDLNLQVVDDIRTVGNRMQQADFAVELQKKLEQAARLLPGQPAPDFKMTDVDGNEKKLSDFRGKLIYIDLWATWCGPCIQESPAFTALSEKYPDIEFLQISRDEQKEAWESYIAHKNSPLTQYNSVDMELAEGWQLFYIPVLFWWIKSRRSSMPMLPDRLLRKLLRCWIHFQKHKQK